MCENLQNLPLFSDSKSPQKLAQETLFSPSILGNYAESSSTNKINDLSASDSAADSSKNKSSKWDADAQLSERYALQEQARKSMLEHHYSLPESDRPKKAHRVCNCRRDLRPVIVGKSNGKNVYEMSKPVIYKHIETSNTFYGGLMVCGSGYACPVDVPKIAEQRAAEIRLAISEWVKSGGVCLFVTLTFPHAAFDSLESSLASLADALKSFRQGRSYKKIMVSLGYVGLIRSIEVTWGEDNGWHPHCHEIWFVRPDFIEETRKLNNEFLGFDKKISVDALTALCDFYLKPALFKQWRSAFVKSGLSEPSYERGMVIKACETEEQLQKRLADYLVKTGLEKAPWGVDDELTKLHSKRGKPGRFTPFDFLRKQYDVESTKGEKYRFRCLFADFVTAFKGKAKVYWSPGLKTKFNIKEFTDKQIAEQKTKNAILAYEVPRPIWVFVIGIGDHRATLLLKVKNEGVQAAKDYLSNLLDSYAEYFDEKYDFLSPNLQYILEYYSEN